MTDDKSRTNANDVNIWNDVVVRIANALASQQQQLLSHFTINWKWLLFTQVEMKSNQKKVR